MSKKKKNKKSKVKKIEKLQAKQQEGVEKLEALGSAIERPTVPDRAILETFPNPHDLKYEIRFKTDEFSSMCPKTGQPDFAEFVIRYQPAELCLETKSLKLYLQSYRSTGAFMEDVTGRIFKDLVKVLEPESLAVEALFNARGGIGTRVIYSTESEESK